MKTTNQELLLTAKLAAQYLASHLGETPELWTYRLANWRRRGSGPVLAVEADPGSPAYRATDLESFAASRQATRSLLTEQNRPRAGATAHLDGDEGPHVRVMFAIGAASQSAFAIDAESVRKLAKMLTKAADLVDRASKGAGDAA